MGQPEQEMPLVLGCERRSDGLGYKIELMDVVNVDFKHYAIAVDIFDHNTDNVLQATLATMNRGDEVTLITFGDHLESAHFNMTEGVQEIVNKMMRRRESGCNIASALYELDRTVCDERILISSGGFDDGEPCVTLQNRVYLISPGPAATPKIEMPSMDPPAVEEVYHPHLTVRQENRICTRRQIRALLGKSRPNYFNIKVEAGGEHYMSPLSFGGIATLHVGNFDGDRIKLSYFDRKGETHYTEINI